MSRVLACLLGGLILLPVARSQENAPESEDSAHAGFAAFLQGRPEDAASAYRYLSTLGVGGETPSANLALLARDAGRPEEALPHWTKATMLAPRDPFLWNQRGWCYLSMARHTDARDAFREALKVSTAAAWTAEAQFGLGLAEETDSNPKSAVPAFLGASGTSPYLYPAATERLARLAVLMKRLIPAELYFKQSLQQDPAQPLLLGALASLYEQGNNPKAAWLAYKAALDSDPTDEQALAGFTRTGKALRDPPERRLPVRRMARPLLIRPVPPPPSPAVRVRLFSNGEGLPAHARRLFFISASDFRIVDSKLGEVNRGKAFDQWELALRQDGNVLELKDPRRQLQYATKQPFRIEPIERGASVLLKSVEVTDVKGVDVGDRELRGAVEVLPTPWGFHLVNELGVEEYLYGRVASAMPTGSAPEALKAQAVILRTVAEKRWTSPTGDMTRTALCDSVHCQVYAGLAQERGEATEAVRASAGAKLYTKGGGLYEPRQHLYCGGRTEEDIHDRVPPVALASPLEVERWAHGRPDRSQACEASAGAGPSWARWVRVLEPEDIRRRLEKDHQIGRIHHARVLKRSPTGRVLAIEIAAAKETVTLEGENAVAAALYPAGGLRSMWFTFQPLYSGKNMSRLVVWGVGTGDGHGLCLAGALGRGHLGAYAYDILRHYYPDAEIRGLPEPPKPKPAAVGARGTPGKVKGRLAEVERRAGARALRERMRQKARERGSLKAVEPPAVSTPAAPTDKKP